MVYASAAFAAQVHVFALTVADSARKHSSHGERMSPVVHTTMQRMPRAIATHMNCYKQPRDGLTHTDVP